MAASDRGLARPLFVRCPAASRRDHARRAPKPCVSARVSRLASRWLSRKAESPDSRYGELIRIHSDGGRPEVLERVALAARVGEGGIDEATLQELLFDHPECLPIAAIDSAYGDPVPVCRELKVPAGSVDALYVAVAWMRDRGNRLVSVLHPRLRRMFAEH